MNPKLTGNPYLTEDTRNIRQVIRYLKDKEYLIDNPYVHYILDVGQRSPLTDAISKESYCRIDNTTGDLDTDFTSPIRIYDTIIYSHTIEHQFNPLYTLLRLREVMDKSSRMFIILPSRTKLLWERGHFHEIDRYRMGLLLDSAGLEIVTYERRKHHRAWYTYFNGIRPLMRLFIEFNAYYEVKIKAI